MVCYCRSAAQEKPVPGTSTNGSEPSPQRTNSGRETRQAFTAKIFAARAHARKLAEEQQAAAAAAELAAEQEMEEALHER